MTFVFILGILVILVGLGIVVWGFRAEIIGAIIGGFLVALVVGGGLIVWSTFWTNAEGEAKVMVNSVDKTVIGSITEAGSGWKEPWVDFIDFDTFAQEAVYAGKKDSAPEYAGGSVNGAEITISVGGINGGSTKGDMDATFVYDIDASKTVTYKGKEMPAIEAIYKQFKSQDRFTKTIVERGGILSVARTVPSGYTAIGIRGVDRPKAELEMQEMLSEELEPYGVTVRQVSIQDVRYSEAVEAALEEVEKANQKAETAEANQRAKAVENETLIAQAQAEADANRILTESLTPEVVEIRRIEALVKAAEKGNIIIDGGDGTVLLPSK